MKQHGNLRFFVMRKKEGKTRFSHTGEVFANIEDAKKRALDFKESRVEGVDDWGQTIIKVIVNE